MVCKQTSPQPIRASPQLAVTTSQIGCKLNLPSALFTSPRRWVSSPQRAVLAICLCCALLYGLGLSKRSPRRVGGTKETDCMGRWMFQHNAFLKNIELTPQDQESCGNQTSYNLLMVCKQTSPQPIRASPQLAVTTSQIGCKLNLPSALFTSPRRWVSSPQRAVLAICLCCALIYGLGLSKRSPIDDAFVCCVYKCSQQRCLHRIA